MNEEEGMMEVRTCMSSCRTGSSTRSGSSSLSQSSPPMASYPGKSLAGAKRASRVVTSPTPSSSWKENQSSTVVSISWNNAPITWLTLVYMC